MILPPPLVAYLNSEATADVESLANCFAADAVVHDEGRAIRGLDAIKAWKKDAKTKYQYTVKPLDAVQGLHCILVLGLRVFLPGLYRVQTPNCATLIVHHRVCGKAIR